MPNRSTWNTRSSAHSEFGRPRLHVKPLGQKSRSLRVEMIEEIGDLLMSCVVGRHADASTFFVPTNRYLLSDCGTEIGSCQTQ
jgi:hypothetical protein